MRIKIFLVIGALALLFGPSTGLTQVGPPGGGGGGGRGDPNQIFDFMAGGKDVWVRSELTDPQAQARFDGMAQRMGITNGQITRQQFVEAAQQRMAQRAAAQPQGGSAPGVTVTLTPNPGGAGAPGGNPWGGGQNPWAGGNPWGGGWGNPPDAVPEDGGEEVKKPIVYKGNNLPKELDWFQLLDTDHDGQVGLYEWRAGGRSIEEFQKRDLNGDGFITVEEIIRYEAKYNPRPKTDPQVASTQGGAGQRGGGAGFPGAGGARGAWPQGAGGPQGGWGGQGGGRRGGGQWNPNAQPPTYQPTTPSQGGGRGGGRNRDRQPPSEGRNAR